MKTNKVNIKCAELTIKKYEKELSEQYTSMIFDTADSCSYCDKYYIYDLYPINCKDCPLSINSRVNCMHYKEMEIIGQYNIDLEDSKYTFDDYHEALHNRIDFHKRLINNGGYVTEEDLIKSRDYRDDNNIKI